MVDWLTTDQVAEDKEADVENIEGALEGHCVGE